MYEYVLIVLALLLIISSIVYTFYFNKPSVNNTEVFCVNLQGEYFLQQDPHNPAKLINGYQYATADDINQAIKNGMRINGVQDGDIALYLSPAYFEPTISPNGYITRAGDFSTNATINFNPTTVTKPSTYWVFIKGFKPNQIYAGIKEMIFLTPNSNILSYVGVLPWNDSQYTFTAPLSTTNEVFLVTASPMPINYPTASNVLNSGFTVATSEQIYWCISQGLSFGECANIWYNNGSNILIESAIFPGIPTPNPILCSNGTYLAVWGVKPKNPNTIISTITTRITSFNSKKYSLYN